MDNDRRQRALEEEAQREELLRLFHEILDMEDKAIITEEFRDISNNDMHIIEAIGIGEPRSMGAVARDLSVTVGTLTIAINGLVKKFYVRRERSQKDRRVVLISLLEKGERAYYHHKEYHERMLSAALYGLNAEQRAGLIQSVSNLDQFFRSCLEQRKEDTANSKSS